MEGRAGGLFPSRKVKEGPPTLHAPAPGTQASWTVPPPAPIFGSPVAAALWGTSRLAGRGRHRAGRPAAPSLPLMSGAEVSGALPTGQGAGQPGTVGAGRGRRTGRGRRAGGAGPTGRIGCRRGARAGQRAPRPAFPRRTPRSRGAAPACPAPPGLARGRGVHPARLRA